MVISLVTSKQVLCIKQHIVSQRQDNCTCISLYVFIQRVLFPSNNQDDRTEGRTLVRMGQPQTITEKASSGVLELMFRTKNVLDSTYFQTEMVLLVKRELC